MKRILALLLSVSMVFCMMPSMVFAAPDDVDISTAEITLVGGDTFAYTGEQIKPVISSVVLTTNERTTRTLKETEDYTVTYGGNKNVSDGGIVTLAAVENSGYTGTATKSFTISPCDIAASTQESTAMAVTGAAKNEYKEYIKLKYGTVTLTDEDFELDSDAPETLNAGLNVFHVRGIGNFTGTKEVSLKAGTSFDGFTAELSNPTQKFTYNGKEHRPSITVKGPDGKSLSTNQYYVEYTSNINAGTASYKVIGSGGDYAGELSASTQTFQILEKPISDYSMRFEIENQPAGIAPKVTVYDTAISTKAPIASDQYRVIVTKHGTKLNDTVELRIEGAGNYNGSINKTAYVKDKLQSNYVLHRSKKYTYTGTAIQPEIYVESADKKYVLNRDYRIVYETSNVNAGVCVFRLEGINDYAGEFYRSSFTIEPKSISGNDTVVNSPETVFYNGSPATPSISVVTAGYTLIKDKDYTVSYSRNNAIGTASIFIEGKGNYTGYVTKTFRIVGKDLSQLSASLSQTSYNYDGLEKKPAVTVYDGTKKLTNGVDYTVAYKNNKYAGTAEVLLTGKGNYGGTKTLTFQIIGKAQTVTTKYTRYSKTLASKVFDLYADHDGDGTLTYRSSDPSVAKVSAAGQVTIVGTGRAIITVSVTGNKAYNPASKEVTVTVKPQASASVKLSTPKTGQVKVLFDKVEGTTKYQVRYGRMGKYYIKEVTHKDNAYTRTYTTLKNRTKGKLYYIKVRAYKELADGTKIYGAWTPTQKIRAK